MIADRIKLARRKAGFSLRDLAEAMQHRVTAQAIGKYERGEDVGEDVPSSGVLTHQGKHYNSGRDRALVETQVLEWIERYLQVELVLELDSADWQCPLPKRQKLRDVNDAEQLAADVRKAWKLGIDPIPNMTELLEEKGLKVLIVTLPGRVSGFTCLVKRPTLPTCQSSS